jgi:hypothetical protein
MRRIWSGRLVNRKTFVQMTAAVASSERHVEAGAQQLRQRSAEANAFGVRGLINSLA